MSENIERTRSDCQSLGEFFSECYDKTNEDYSDAERIGEAIFSIIDSLLEEIVKQEQEDDVSE